MRRRVSILGSTGSIGVNTLRVIADFSELFEVCALSAGCNLELLAEQIRQFKPRLVSIKNSEDIPRLQALLGAATPPEIQSGNSGNEAVAAEASGDVVVTAMVGAAGLRPTLAAIRRGARVAIANKEPLVVAGELCTREAARCGATLLPVDSEHSAIFQCLHGRQADADVHRILLTCSGGPFRQTQDLSKVTLEQALKHPTWSMGKKITIDSATLMNKGLEIIEARWLFGLPAEQIDVVIHPQSVIHSMVEFADGSVIAQLGTPDMRVPIGFALSYPRRLALPVPHLDWQELGQLSFEAPDRKRFNSLNLAYAALRLGGTAPAVVNAANEVGVAAFLNRQIDYLQITQTIERTLDQHNILPADALEPIIEADGWARQTATSLIDNR